MDNNKLQIDEAVESDEIFFDELRLNETDIDGVLSRLSGDKELYLTLLSAFPADTTMEELETALNNKAWDNAFTAAHALKGLTGNLGFTPLFHSIGKLVIVIRAGRVGEIDATFKTVKNYYNDIVSVITNNIKIN